MEILHTCSVCLSLANGSDHGLLKDAKRLPETQRKSLLLLCYSEIFSEQFHLDENSTPARARLNISISCDQALVLGPGPLAVRKRHSLTRQRKKQESSA